MSCGRRLKTEWTLEKPFKGAEGAKYLRKAGMESLRQKDRVVDEPVGLYFQIPSSVRRRASDDESRSQAVFSAKSAPIHIAGRTGWWLGLFLRHECCPGVSLFLIQIRR